MKMSREEWDIGGSAFDELDEGNAVNEITEESTQEYISQAVDHLSPAHSETNANSAAESLVNFDPNSSCPDPEFLANITLTDDRTVFVARFYMDDSSRNVSHSVIDLKGRKWQLLCNWDEFNGNMGLYLELVNYLDFDYLPVTVRFGFALLNVHDMAKSFPRDSLENSFSRFAKDFGYPHAYSRDKVLSRDEMGRFNYVENDRSFRISVVIDHVPTITEDFSVGMVGLKNQGATCYMNSLLQTLFNLRRLRKAVYDLNTQLCDSHGGLALALQRTFYKLQTSKNAVGTKELTKSFGWGIYDSYTQQDVHELNRVLMDKLEKIMQGTAQDGVISGLFEGVTRAYIKCVNVQYESKRDETFHDVQLEVKGCKDIYDSFSCYTAEELLNGDNKYDAGPEFGKQEAKKGVRFLKFPPVLNIHLKRFEYDLASRTMIKVNDRFEFPYELDLEPYLANDAYRDPARPNKYVLHSILVHTGDLSSGHYFAYIRPSNNPKRTSWVKFDDEYVSPVLEQDALEVSYGYDSRAMQEKNIDPRNFWGTSYKPRESSNYSSAYMLVYIRVCDLSTVMLGQGVEDSLIPSSLLERVRKEELLRQKTLKDKEEAHLWCKVLIADEKMIEIENDSACEKTDFVNFASRDPFFFLRTQHISEVYKRLAEEMNFDVLRIRLWYCFMRENRTIRPAAPLEGAKMGQPIENACDNSFPCHLYVEQNVEQYPEFDSSECYSMTLDEKIELLCDGKSYPPVAQGHAILFFKQYVPMSVISETEDMHCIVYKGSRVLPRDESTSSLEDASRELANASDNQCIKLYEQLTHKRVHSIDSKKLISDIELVNGDIIIFQCVDDDDDDDDENDSSEWADLLLSSNSESEDTRGADEESSPTDTPPHLTKRRRITKPKSFLSRTNINGIHKFDVTFQNPCDYFCFSMRKRIIRFKARISEYSVYFRPNCFDEDRNELSMEFLETDSCSHALQIFSQFLEHIDDYSQIRLYRISNIYIQQFQLMGYGWNKRDTLKKALLGENLRGIFYFEVLPYAIPKSVSGESMMILMLCHDKFIMDCLYQVNKHRAVIKRYLNDLNRESAPIAGSNIGSVLPYSESDSLFVRDHFKSFVLEMKRDAVLHDVFDASCMYLRVPTNQTQNFRIISFQVGLISDIFSSSSMLGADFLDSSQFLCKVLEERLSLKDNMWNLLEYIPQDEMELHFNDDKSNLWMPLQVTLFSFGTVNREPYIVCCGTPMLTYIQTQDNLFTLMDRVINRRGDLVDDKRSLGKYFRFAVIHCNLTEFEYIDEIKQENANEKCIESELSSTIMTGQKVSTLWRTLSHHYPHAIRKSAESLLSIKFDVPILGINKLMQMSEASMPRKSRRYDQGIRIG